MIPLIANVDALVLHLCIALRTPFLVQVFLVVTELGSPQTITLITVGAVIIFAHQRRWRDALALLVSVVGSSLVTDSIKELVGRARPGELVRVYNEVGYSFPSGHATAAVALYGFIAYILWRDYRSHLDHRITLSIAAILILAIGFSRIYLGEHYSSDVIGGYVVGALFLTVAMRIARK
jgi:undecaprenyl-diphosphatase